MMYPLVRDLAAAEIPVTVTCRVLGFSKQAFYKWNARPVSDRDWEEAHLIDAAYDVHADDPEFGHRFIADELQAAGHRVSERRVWRLCSQQQIFSATVRRAKRGGAKPGPPVCDDLLQRDFTAESINTTWLTDITEHRTGEGKLYLCAIKDACSGRIVGYAIDRRMKSGLAVAALKDAVARRGASNVAGCVVHSDRGSQFRSRKF
ncbi:IS3 family transposase, partial [Zafaria sp. J156]